MGLQRSLILFLQTSYCLYRPSAVTLANFVSDLPFSASRVLLFNIIIYFLSGLHRSAGAFLTFYLLNYTCYLCIQGLFRTLGILCSNFESAFRLVAFCVPNMYAFKPHFFSDISWFPSIQYSGYVIPVVEMPKWLSWMVRPLFTQKNGDRIGCLAPISTTSTPWLTVHLSTWIGPGI